MTHQHASNGSNAEEVKDGSQQTSSTSPQSTQCCVYFAPSEWSRRYGEEFYTARVTSSQQSTDGSHSLSIALKCADTEWSVERPYSAFRQLASDIAASYRVQTDGSDTLPPLPVDKADADMQSWMDGTLQRKDISRLSAVRQFLNLDIVIQSTQQQQQDDSDDEQQQTAVEGENGESKQAAAAAGQ